MRTIYTSIQTAESILNAVMTENIYCGLSWRYGVLRAAIPVKENARCRNIGPFKTKNKKHDAKLTKNIEIEGVTNTTSHMLVHWKSPETVGIQTLKIDRFAFEQWLYETCRLDWCLHELSGDRQAFEGDDANVNCWIYGAYGVGLQELGTYMVEHRLALIVCG